MLSLAIFSEITVEDKIGSIIDSEMNSEFENIALEMSKLRPCYFLVSKLLT